MLSGKEKSSRSRGLAHAAALLAVGFLAGLSARTAMEHVELPRAAQFSLEARDAYVVTPATHDAPAMAMWVATELDRGSAEPGFATRTLAAGVAAPYDHALFEASR